MSEPQSALDFGARSAAIIESASDAIISATLDGVITTWNGAAERLFGTSAAAAIGRSIGLIITADERADLPGYLARLARGERIEGIQTLGQHRDGHTFRMSLSAFSVREPDGTIDGIACIVRDMTEQHQLEAALRASERRVRRLIDSNIIGITLADLEGRILDANDALLRMVGYSRDDLSAGRLRWDEMTPPEYLPLDDMAVAEAHRSGAAGPWEKDYIRKDGTRIPVMVGVAMLDERAGTTVAFILDLSEQKRGEAERNQLLAENQRQQALLEAVFAATPTCLLVVNGPESTIRFVNAAYLVLMPHPDANLVGLSLEEVWSDAAEIGLLAAVQQTSRTGVAAAVDRYQHTYADGSTRSFELRVIALDWLGEPGALIALWDITPLEQARAAAEAAVRTRDEFISVASHELKTPIAGLLAVTQLARSRIARGMSLSQEQVSDLIGHVKSESERLNSLTARLLDTSRIQAGTLALEREATDLVELVQGIVHAASAAERITVTAPAELIADVDPLRFEQVVRNLVENAIKYSPPGSRIEVDLERVSADLARLAVRDHGPGIAVEHRGRIFEPFYRAHSDVQVAGMGLGLHISRQIVELHGGHIDIEFPDDGGTRFVVSLPLASPQPDQS